MRRQSEQYQKFLNDTAELLGKEIRDPQSAEFNRLFRRAMRKEPHLSPKLHALLDLRNELIFQAKKSVQRADGDGVFVSMGERPVENVIR